jgi:thimet oligopeptidase
MLEDWAYDGRVLALMPQVCAACLALPEELLAQAIVARDFGKGGRFGRQHLYAAYDLALHRSAEPDPLGLWARMEGATPLGHVAGSKFPAGFAHLAGSYGAGYYGYLWSLVVAMDLRTAFAADKLDPAVGRRYRDGVLAQGAQRPAPALVKDFLGRESSAEAFFDELRK